MAASITDYQASLSAKCSVDNIQLCNLGFRSCADQSTTSEEATIDGFSRFDVLLGRGKGNRNTPGNMRYQGKLESIVWVTHVLVDELIVS